MNRLLIVFVRMLFGFSFTSVFLTCPNYVFCVNPGLPDRVEQNNVGKLTGKNDDVKYLML